MFGVVVNELLVNFVRQNVDVFLGRDIDDRLQFLARVNRAASDFRAEFRISIFVRGVIAFSKSSARIFQRVALARRHDHRLGAGQSHHIGITDPVRRRNDDFIAGLTGCEDCVVTGSA